MRNDVLDYDFDPDLVRSLESSDNPPVSGAIQSEDSDDDIDDPITDDQRQLTSTESEDSDGEPSSDKVEPSEHLSLHVVDNPKSTLNPLTRFLFKFATKFSLSDKAMSCLMQGLTNIDCTGEFYVPKDFRTIHNAIVRSDNSANQGEDDLVHDDALTSAGSGVSVTYICSKCNSHEFDEAIIKAQKACGQCGSSVFVVVSKNVTAPASPHLCEETDPCIN